MFTFRPDIQGIHQVKPDLQWSDDGRLLIMVTNSASGNRLNLFRAEGKYPLLDTHVFDEDSIVATKVPPFIAVKSNKLRVGTVHLIDTTALTQLGKYPMIGPSGLDRMVKYDTELNNGMHNTRTLFKELPHLSTTSLLLHETPRILKPTSTKEKDYQLPAATLLGYAAQTSNVEAVGVILTTITGGMQLPVIDGATAFRDAVETGVAAQIFLDRLVQAKDGADNRQKTTDSAVHLEYVIGVSQAVSEIICSY